MGYFSSEPEVEHDFESSLIDNEDEKKVANEVNVKHPHLCSHHLLAKGFKEYLSI